MPAAWDEVYSGGFEDVPYRVESAALHSGDDLLVAAAHTHVWVRKTVGVRGLAVRGGV